MPISEDEPIDGCSDCQWAFFVEDLETCLNCGWHVCRSCRPGHAKAENEGL